MGPWKTDEEKEQSQIYITREYTRKSTGMYTNSRDEFYNFGTHEKHYLFAWTHDQFTRSQHRCSFVWTLLTISLTPLLCSPHELYSGAIMTAKKKKKNWLQCISKLYWICYSIRNRVSRAGKFRHQNSANLRAKTNSREMRFLQLNINGYNCHPSGGSLLKVFYLCAREITYAQA